MWMKRFATDIKITQSYIDWNWSDECNEKCTRHHVQRVVLPLDMYKLTAIEYTIIVNNDKTHHAAKVWSLGDK